MMTTLVFPLLLSGAAMAEAKPAAVEPTFYEDVPDPADTPIGYGTYVPDRSAPTHNTPRNEDDMQREEDVPRLPRTPEERYRTRYRGPQRPEMWPSTQGDPNPAIPDPRF